MITTPTQCILAFDASQVYNFIEIFIWAGMGLFCLLKLNRVAAVLKRNQIILAVTFVVFGLSDLAEIYTGNWWTPWWMLVWKAACLISMALCLGKLYLYYKKPSR